MGFRCSSLGPNNAFKPKPLRSTKYMAEKACHVFGSTTRFGLTQALGLMSLLVIPIGFVLVLVAVSLLFARRPASGTDWPELFAICLIGTTLILFSWSFQYGKYLNHHGSYYFSPVYGGTIDTSIHIIALVVMVVVVWKYRHRKG